MMEGKWYGIFVALLCLDVAIVSSISSVPTDFENKVTDFLNAGLGCHDNPGMTLSVVKDGETVLARCVVGNLVSF